jgi:hypothetical protein
MLDDLVIYAKKGEDWEEELRVQDDGSLVLVTVLKAPPPGIPGEIGSVMSAEEALEHFPEHGEKIAAALSALQRRPPT